MSFFLNDKNEPRSGWKFAAYLVFLVLLFSATGFALSIVWDANFVLNYQLSQLLLTDIVLLVPAVGAMWLTIRFVDHRSFETFGIGFVPKWRAHLLIGLGAAGIMLGVLVAGCYAFGYVSIHWTGNQAPARVLLATLGLLLVAAANEELLFRGLPLRLLVEGIGEWPAMIVMSALFGALHWTNPDRTILSTANTIVAGILMSLAYVRSGSLWMPYGIHVGWNVGMSFIFGFPLSGIDIASLWTTGTAGSETILGGGYGPEGGLLATFIFGAAAVIVNRHGSINPNQAPVSGGAGRHHRNRTRDS